MKQKIANCNHTMPFQVKRQDVITVNGQLVPHDDTF